MMHLYVGHEYKPVGQGLFAYGNLKMLHTPKGKRHIKYAGQAPDWEFHWVYDCGSSSGQTLVNRGIQDIASKLNGKSLDLVVISHLHFDHISGLLELLRKVRDEHNYTGSLTTVTYYVREQKRRTKEVFVPLSHRPGHAQVDFGETLGVIGGLECKIHFFVMSLPHSDAVFVKGYPAETTEAFCDGHVSAFAFFGGIPQSILYDNTKIAVARILGDRTRVRTQRFTELRSHYLFDDRFGRPARGNDKGNVEGMVGYTRRNFMVPAPRYDSFDDLNAHLEAKCLARQDETLRGHDQTIGARLMTDLDALMGLPVAEYEACDHVSTRATLISMVRYRGNDYSVPVAYAHHDVHVRGFVHEVIIGCGGEMIARHQRSYAKADMIFDPIHFLPLIEQKVGALDQAAPLQGWELPDVFATLHRLLEARMGKPGKREYVQVLRLLETFDMDIVQGATSQAIDMGAIGYDAVKHLVLCRVEKRPPRLDLEFYPYLPKANVGTTRPSSYMSLIAGTVA